MKKENKELQVDPRSQEEIAVAFNRADHIVTKKYLKQLTAMPIVEIQVGKVKEYIQAGENWVESERDETAADHSCFFEIGKLVYDSEENNIQKLTNVYSAAASTHSNIALIIQSDGKTAHMYMGVYGNESRSKLQPKAESLRNFLTGNFQGSILTDLEVDGIRQLVNSCFSSSNAVVSSVSGVASARTDELEDNAQFNQGIEKLLDTMRGEPFSAIFLADSLLPDEIEDIKAEYELLYSALVPFSRSSLTLSDSQSDGVTKTLSESLADTVGTNSSSALSVGTSQSQAHTEGEAKTHSDTAGVGVGTYKGVHAGINFGGIGIGGNAGSSFNVNYSHTVSRTKSFSDTTTFGQSKTSTRTEGSTKAHTVTKVSADGTTETFTYGKSLQLSYESRTILNLMKNIDAQLERIKSSESFGMFAISAYFLAPDRPLAEMAASSYKAIMSGTNTGLEVAAINTWDQEMGYDKICAYLQQLHHPVFRLDHQNVVTPASLVSAQELAIQMGLPKKSVAGVSVIESAPFGRNIYKVDGERGTAEIGIELGCMYHMGQEDQKTPIYLDLKSLAMHTFITGSTGSGKSNTVFQIISELKKRKKSFLVIEPAKGEYKHFFGNDDDVAVYGTNPYKSDLLRINPFKFPEGIHILEHLDRLVEIFNVCWPMYAAMPAVLKEAIERSYVVAGWNLRTSRNRYNSQLFPNFEDVLEQIQIVLSESAYSSDNKGDYTGALTTRLKSLTNGINGMIFTCDDIPDEKLFDRNVIVDLSRVGSSETKSLIMGLLVMKLQEYRMCQSDGIKEDLKHITILEEAHNLLKRTSSEQSLESGNLAGKSVEMLANAIAEMRAYGEGFIIADQAPALLDMAVIRNTNTKIILRLPDYSDRELVGKAAGLNDGQIEELAKLGKGVAAVYQNDWIEAVLCKVKHYAKGEKNFKFTTKEIESESSHLQKTFLDAIIKNELAGRVEAVDKDIIASRLPTQFKCRLYDYLASSDAGKLEALSKLVYSFFNSTSVMEKCTPNLDVASFKRTAREYIEPALGEYSDTEVDLVLFLLLHEQSLRNPDFLPLYIRYSEDIQGRVV